MGSKPKPAVIKTLEKLAANDAEHGRDSNSNPNNKPNGK